MAQYPSQAELVRALESVAGWLDYIVTMQEGSRDDLLHGIAERCRRVARGGGMWEGAAVLNAGQRKAPAAPPEEEFTSVPDGCIVHPGGDHA